jgi:hypothetical protein
MLPIRGAGVTGHAAVFPFGLRQAPAAAANASVAENHTDGHAKHYDDEGNQCQQE